MSKKILVLSVSTNYGKSIAKLVADQLGMYFLSIDDYIEYYLLDSVEYLKKCGKEAYLKKEKNAIEDSLEFENMIYSCSYDVFINNESKFEDFKIFYAILPKNKLNDFDEDNLIVNQIAFSDRDKILKQIGQICEYKNNPKVVAQEIIKKVGISL